MMYVRMKFKKEQEAKFISHLDLMRTFQRAMRRAKIPMVYSGGFNPHPEMSFAQALGLGISSIGEYMDVTIRDILDLQEIKCRLNNNLPRGIEVIKIVLLKEKAKSAMSLVTHGQYLINLIFDLKDISNIKNEFANFIHQVNIYAKKVQPKKNYKIIEVDIKPLIRDIKITTEDNTKKILINCIISCGSKANLKPELIVNALEDYLDVKVLNCKIKRVELFIEAENTLIPLIEVDSI